MVSDMLRSDNLVACEIRRRKQLTVNRSLGPAMIVRSRCSRTPQTTRRVATTGQIIETGEQKQTEKGFVSYSSSANGMPNTSHRRDENGMVNTSYQSLLAAHGNSCIFGSTRT
jgi:hypothetical protein